MTAELLRRAADLIEQRAAGATPGPWCWGTFHGVDELVHPQWFGGWPAHPLNVLKVSHQDWPATEEDKAWIAMLGPQVAAPLAAWLRAEADCIDSTAAATEHLPRLTEAIEENLTRKSPRRHELRVTISTANEAVALARALLGEQR